MMYFKLPVISWLRRKEESEDLEELFELPDSGMHRERSAHTADPVRRDAPVEMFRETENDPSSVLASDPADPQILQMPLPESKQSTALSESLPGKSAAAQPSKPERFSAEISAEQYSFQHSASADPSFSAYRRRSAENLNLGPEKNISFPSGRTNAEHGSADDVRLNEKNFTDNLGVIAGCSMKQLRFLRRTYELLRNTNNEKYYY